MFIFGIRSTHLASCLGHKEYSRRTDCYIQIKETILDQIYRGFHTTSIHHATATKARNTFQIHRVFILFMRGDTHRGRFESRDKEVKHQVANSNLCRFSFSDVFLDAGDSGPSFRNHILVTISWLFL